MRLARLAVQAADGRVVGRKMETATAGVSLRECIHQMLRPGSMPTGRVMPGQGVWCFPGQPSSGGNVGSGTQSWAAH